MALGSRTDLRLAESVQAAAGSIRKAGRHSRSILVLGVRSDLLALLASRLGGGVKTNFSRNSFTRHRLTPEMLKKPAYFSSFRRSGAGKERDAPGGAGMRCASKFGRWGNQVLRGSGLVRDQKSTAEREVFS